MTPRWAICRAGGFALSLAALAGDAATPPALRDTQQLYGLNVRRGFAAQAGFEAVFADQVPLRAGAAAGRLESATYLLDRDVNAFEVKQAGLEHLKYVTLDWKSAAGEAGFALDLYLHGEPEDTNPLAFRIPGLDIRKFLHQSIAPAIPSRALARLQAYFAEFSRKAKIVYPLAPSASGAHGSPFQEQALASLSQHLRELMEMSGEEDDDRRKKVMRALEAARPETANLATLDHHVRMLLAARSVPDDAAFGHLLKATATIVSSIAAAANISDLLVVNNCREPGNYEIALRDALGRRMLQGAFNFPPGAYDRILRRYHGLGIGEQGTGTHVAGAMPTPGHGMPGTRSWEKSLPRVTIEELAALVPEGSGPATLVAGPIQVARGFIPYGDYDVEVRRKSGYERGVDEPLAYVAVDPEKPVPAGFEAPYAGSRVGYWNDPANAGKAVPHRFLSFEDLNTYDVHLSGFAPNGVYFGRSDLTLYDRERQAGRWRFDFRYLGDLDRFEVRSQGDLVEIRLLSGRDAERPVGFVFGNISLEAGESVVFPLGIAAQPVIAPYNVDVFQEPMLYGAAYDADGIILDHHDWTIGVEQVTIERLQRDRYKVRLVSHERILPVWEGTLFIDWKIGRMSFQE